MGLVPEEAVHLGLPGDLDANSLEVVTEGIGVEAGSVQHLTGVGGNLTVVDVVLQEQTDLLAAEVLTDAPGVSDNTQAHLMCLLDDGIDVGEPEVHVELGDREDDGIATVCQHFFKILIRIILKHFFCIFNSLFKTDR